VFTGDFADVTRQLASALPARREKWLAGPLDVLLCTNLPYPAPQFRRLVQDALPADAQLYGQTKVGITPAHPLWRRPEGQVSCLCSHSAATRPVHAIL
jgi:hypothetical protein